MAGIAALSTLIRALPALRVQAPTLFSDELGYTRLAESIGRTGRLALFGHDGMSYPPLYSVVLSPIYAVGASAPTAYGAIKVVDALLISLAVFPAYGIARFVLPRRPSLLVAALTALAPPMLYPAFTISENLAYPLCLVAVWAMLQALRTPSPRADAVLLGSILLASAARFQLVVLLPAALTAIVSRGAGRRQHVLLYVVVGGVAIVVASVALAGLDVLSVFGKDAIVFRSGFPNLAHLSAVLVRELAGVDLAVGVVPFVGALVAAFALARSAARRPEHLDFAAVAIAVTGWLLLEVAFYAALFDDSHLHERLLIYVVPFFLVALIAACALPTSRASDRFALAAAALAALLPAVIPFDRFVDDAIATEATGLHLFARGSDVILPVAHATLVAIGLSAALALLYVRMRARTPAVVILVLIPFVAIWGLGTSRIQARSESARMFLPDHSDWVDRAEPAGDVILVGGRQHVEAEQSTAYANLSVRRIYYVCKPVFGSEFGERKLTVATDHLRAPLVVAESALGIRGRILARNLPGHQVLVAPKDGLVTIPPVRLAGLLKCEP